MPLLRNITSGLRSLFQKKQVDRELKEEFSGYLEIATQEKIKQGMNRRDALRSVRLEQGNFEVTREVVRLASWESLVESSWQDLRYAARQLRANQLFTAAAIFSLALGIGANTAIFQLLDAVRLRTLPVRNPQEIAKVAIDHRGSATGHFSTRYPDLTYAMWEQIRKQQQGFSEDAPVAAFNIVSPGYFETLQTRILSGRDFDDHDTPAAPKVAIMNEEFAKQYAKNANPVGMKFRVRRLQSTELYEIIGLVRNTKYTDLRENFGPIVYTVKAQFENPGTGAQILVRSHTGLVGLTAAIKNTVAGVNPNMDITFSSLRQTVEDSLLRDRLMARLSGFFAVLAVVLAVIGLYGVMSYMVAQRRSEIAIRMALGAEPASIIRLVMRESGRLLLVGMAIGVALALGGGRAAAAMLFGLKPGDPLTLGTALLSLSVVAALASLLPARRASHCDPMTALRNE